MTCHHEPPICLYERIEALLLLGYPERATAPAFIAKLNADGIAQLDRVAYKLRECPDCAAEVSE